MSKLTRVLWVALLGAIVQLAPLESQDAAPASTDREPLVVFLVRHAEKTDAGRDPKLSEAGQHRAATLAQALRSAAIEAIHSSDTLRTRSTAKPVAEKIDREVELYDPRDLNALASQLRKSGGRHLVVGHSNTTPALVKLLGGEPGSAIEEKGEYDRLYIVTILEGATSTVMMRYGAPFTPSGSK